MLNTPVVFLIFRRPDLTAQVFEAIRQAKPTKLLVVADGPRNEDEVVLCQQSREITEQIDWECEVFRNYSDVNLGCRERVASGITWAFEQVEEAIILEDDCLPHPSFFRYCSELLAHYRDDERIWCISGDNFQDGQKRGDGSYYFSRYNHCWGWASWRRCWQHYDGELKQWTHLKASGLLDTIFEDSLERNYWTTIWDRLLLENQPDSWAYRWTLTCLANSGLTILPNVNLVSNIGFREDATHTKGEAKPTPTLEDIGTLCHPSFVIRDRAADEYIFDHVFGGNVMREANTLSSRLRSHLSINKKRIIRLFTDPIGLFTAMVSRILPVKPV